LNFLVTLLFCTICKPSEEVERACMLKPYIYYNAVNEHVPATANVKIEKPNIFQNSISIIYCNILHPKFWRIVGFSTAPFTDVWL